MPEQESAAFEEWIRQVQAPKISSLTLVEVRCLPARRRRMGDLDEQSETAAYNLLVQDVDTRHLDVEAIGDGDVRAAAHLLRHLATHSARSTPFTCRFALPATSAGLPPRTR